MESLKIAEEFDKIYINKCKNAKDVELKFKELIYLSGLDIDFNIEKEEFYLNLPNKRVRMEKGEGNTYYVQDGDKLIGVHLKELYLLLGLDIEMEIFIKDGYNFQDYCFKQKYHDHGDPWFYYNDYINGEAFEFSSDGHKLYVRKANVPLGSTFEIANSWGEYIAIPKRKLNARLFSFGGTKVLVRCNEKGEKLYEYIPSVKSKIIKDNMSVEHSIVGEEELPQLYEVSQQYYHSGVIYASEYPGYEHSKMEYLDMKNAIKTFKYNDPELMNYCIRVAQIQDNIDLFSEAKEYLYSLKVGKYINKYFQRLIDGVDYYQNVYIINDKSQITSKIKKLNDKSQIISKIKKLNDKSQITSKIKKLDVKNLLGLNRK